MKSYFENLAAGIVILAIIPVALFVAVLTLTFVAFVVTIVLLALWIATLVSALLGLEVVSIK